MSYTTPGTPRKPGENLSQGEPEQTADGDTPVVATPLPPRRSAGAPKKGAPHKTGTKPAAGKAPKGRPVTPVKVSQQKNWGAIALFTAVGLLFVGIIGYAGWDSYQNNRTWQEKAAAIKGVTDFTKDHAKDLGAGNHVTGKVTYFASPPVGGAHNQAWENCMGDIYKQQIPNEHAVHSLEHGAVWVTYDPKKLTPADVVLLGKKVKGNEFMLMSPFPDLGSPITLQAWGFQLKVDKVSDERIDEFVSTVRKNSSQEPGATCSGGVNVTGTTPSDAPPTAPTGG